MQDRNRHHSRVFSYRACVCVRVCVCMCLRETERERGRSRPTLIDYTAIDRDPEKQALTFLLIELNTFYGANRWDGDDGGGG